MTKDAYLKNYQEPFFSPPEGRPNSSLPQPQQETSPSPARSRSARRLLLFPIPQPANPQTLAPARWTTWWSSAARRRRGRLQLRPAGSPCRRPARESGRRRVAPQLVARCSTAAGGSREPGTRSAPAASRGVAPVPEEPSNQQRRGPRRTVRAASGQRPAVQRTTGELLCLSIEYVSLN